MTDFSDLIGLTFEEAKDKAASKSYVVRVSVRDNMPMLGTGDHVVNRLNLSMVKGVVASVGRPG